METGFQGERKNPRALYERDSRLEDGHGPVRDGERGFGVLVVTECGLSDRLLLEMPEKKFYKACKLCQYMKMITLEDTLKSLQLMRQEITLDEDVRPRAETALRRMFGLS